MEKGKKERALITSFIIHAMLILLAIFPLVSMVKFDAGELADKYQVIEIAFENVDMSPSTSSIRPAEEKVDLDKVISKNNNEKPVGIKEEYRKPGKNEEISTVDQTEIIMDKGVRVEDVAEAEIVHEEISYGNSGENAEGAGSDTAGEGETGEEITGFSLANMDFEGEGVFGRQIVYHANISKLAEKEGRVVVNLCINRFGVVTHVAFNREASTLTESVYVREVMRVAAKYRFEKDYTAPKVQCGKLSFVFKFN